MKERPILFSAPMVRALLDGTKTQTRRIVKPQPQDWQHLQPMWGTSPPPNPVAFGRPGVVRPVAPDWPDGAADDIVCPYGQPGDRLWVRETWAQPAALDPGPTVYRADYPACVPHGYTNIPPADEIRWKPSIHMFRKGSRIILEVVSVRVERLNDCSAVDAIAEGIRRIGEGFERWHPDPADTEHTGTTKDPVLAYRGLWESINGAGSWAANPWVWVVEFKRLEAA
jgi:hypothetical protein